MCFDDHLGPLINLGMGGYLCRKLPGMIADVDCDGKLVSFSVICVAGLLFRAGRALKAMQEKVNQLADDPLQVSEPLSVVEAVLSHFATKFSDFGVDDLKNWAISLLQVGALLCQSGKR